MLRLSLLNVFSNNLINVLSANLENVSSESKNSMNCNNQNYSTNPDINTFDINNNSPSKYNFLNRITETNNVLSLRNKIINNDINCDTNLNIMT